METKNFIITQQRGENIWSVAIKAYEAFFGKNSDYTATSFDSFDRNGWNIADDEFEVSPVKRIWLVLYLTKDEYEKLHLKSEANGGMYQFGYVNNREDLYIFLKEVHSLD
jgi:hypothetical protein